MQIQLPPGMCEGECQVSDIADLELLIPTDSTQSKGDVGVEVLNASLITGAAIDVQPWARLGDGSLGATPNRCLTLRHPWGAGTERLFTPQLELVHSLGSQHR